jgi:hypothetical protein
MALPTFSGFYVLLGAFAVLWLLRSLAAAGRLAIPLRWPRLARRRGRPRLRVVGVHPVRPTLQQFQAALAALWGEDLGAEERQSAEDEVRSHFAALFLIEAEITPPAADFDWSGVTQEVPGEPRSSWQVPYDERQLTESGRWAFFFHRLDLERPLLTPAGPVTLPAPSPAPQRLRTVEYEAP